MSFDVNKIRLDFPIFQNLPNLVYFDNAATTQKPRSVVESQINFYTKLNSNVHRGNYDLANQATSLYEAARDEVQTFINAEFREEIIFTGGATEAINQIAGAFSSDLGKNKIEINSENENCLKSGDEILISQMEHHANLVPWQMLATEKNLKLKFIPLTQNNEIDFEAFLKLLNPKTKLVAVTHVSNILGVVNPIKQIAFEAHKNGSLIFVDGSQAVSHFNVDVQDLDVDFYCFSGHKIFAPTGVGVLYGKKQLLNSLPPTQGGGDMIETVDFTDTTFNQIPYKFEAGTPNIAGVIGLAEAIKYFVKVFNSELVEHENTLYEILLKGLLKIDGLNLVDNAINKICIQGFDVQNVHPQDLAMYLGQKNICIRSGFHCTQPLINKLGFINGINRISLSFYNTTEEIDKFLFYLKKGIQILK